MLRLPVIVGTLPNTIANGQTEDAVPVMANFNHIVSQVNANAAPLSNTALLASANTFTQVQSGVAATSPANFPIASQVQQDVFRTFQSTLGTNSLTARIAALPLTQFVTDEIFSWIPAQTNTGAAGFTAIDTAGSTSIFSGGQPLVGGEMRAGIPAMAKRVNSRLELLATPYSRGTNAQVFGFLTSEVSGTRGFTLGNGLGIQGATLFGAQVNYLTGLNMSTPGTSSLTLGSGAATDTSGSVNMIVSSSMTKTTGAWAAGTGNGMLDTGAIAANTWYHIYLIMRPDTYVTDFLASLSATSPVVPQPFSSRTLIGSWITDGSSNWALINNNGARFEWQTPALDISHTNPGTAAFTHSLSSGVPTNRPNVIALLSMQLSVAAVGNSLIVTPLDVTDSAPSGTVAPLNTIWTTANNTASAPFECRVDANASVRTRVDGSDASVVVRGVARGWIDPLRQ